MNATTQADDPLISVVTPFFNTAPYLAECIESVLAQTHANWEYLLVNNRSNDGSREIAARYAAQDARIRLVDNETFLSQIQNYNRGLAQISAQSRYTKVLEADNWLYADCLARMAALMELHPNVGLVSAYNITEDTVRFFGLPTAQTVVDGREVARLHLRQQAYLFGAPTTVLMRSNIVRAKQPFYDEIHAEDLSACYEILRAWDFGFVHEILAFVRTRNSSLLSNVRALANQSDFNGTNIDQFVLLERHGRDFLSPEDLRHAQRAAKKSLYRQMAVGALGLKGKQFWQLHRVPLENVGQRVEWSVVGMYVLSEVLRKVLNPGSTGAALLRRAKQKISGN